MTSVTDFDIGSLIWVKAEIDQALDQAAASLRQQTEQPQETGQLRFSLTHLHQVTGAINMVGLDALGKYSEEIELVVQAIDRKEKEIDARSLAMITESIRAMKAYLEDLVEGRADAVLVLFPFFARLRQFRGETVSEAELFFPELNVGVPPFGGANDVNPNDLIPYLKSQRSRFQLGLLQWLRDQNPAGLQTMFQILRNIARVQTSAMGRGFWWAAATLVEVVAYKGATLDSELRQVFTRLDLQLRRAAEGSNKVAERLFRDLLYYIARSTVESPNIKAVRQAFRLDAYLPKGALDLDRANAAARAQDAKTVLQSVKDAWGKFSGGNAGKREACLEGLTQLHQAADKLGQTDFLHVVDAIIGAIDSHPGTIADTSAMEVATALLLLENALNLYPEWPSEFPQQAELIQARLDAVAKSDRDRLATMDDLPLLDDATRKAQERQLQTQVAREIRSNLQQIEQALDAYFREQLPAAELLGLDGQLKQIHGALAILDMPAAQEVLAHCARLIRSFADDGRASTLEERQDVAEGLSALGFYIDEYELGRDAGNRVLTPILARIHGYELETKPAAEAAPAVADSIEAEILSQKNQAIQLLDALREKPQDTEVKDQLVETLSSLQRNADLVADSELIENSKTALKLLENEEEAAHEQLQEVLVGQESEDAPAEAEVELLSDEAVDAELLEVYLEEAQEVLGNVAAQLEICRANPHDKEALTVIRRSYHTLKGSGRMVGLNNLGEVAWSVEQMMNRLLQDERGATPAVLHVLETASADFLKWVEQLQAQGSVRLDPKKLVIEADALRDDPDLSLDALKALSAGKPAAAETDAEAVLVAPVVVETAESPAASAEDETAAEETPAEADAFGGTPVEDIEIEAALPVETTVEESVPFAFDTVEDSAPAPVETPVEEILPETDIVLSEAVSEEAIELGPLPDIEPAPEVELNFAFDLDMPPARPDAAEALHDAQAVPETVPEAVPEAEPFAFDLETAPADEAVAQPVDDVSAPVEAELPALDLDLEVPPQANEAEPASDVRGEDFLIEDLPVLEPVSADVPDEALAAAEDLAELKTLDDVAAEDVVVADAGTTGAPAEIDFDLELDGELPATAASEPAPAAQASDEIQIGPVSISPVLFGIFAEEAQKHLDTLRNGLTQFEQDSGRGLDSRMLFASHTLRGIANTTGFSALGSLGEALESWLATHSQASSSASADNLPLLREAVGECSRIVDEILAQRWPEVTEDVIDRLNRAVEGTTPSNAEMLQASIAEREGRDEAAVADSGADPAMAAAVVTAATNDFDLGEAFAEPAGVDFEAGAESAGVEDELVFDLTLDDLDALDLTEPAPETEAVQDVGLTLDAGADTAEAIEVEAAVEPEPALDLEQELSAGQTPETEAVDDFELDFGAESDAVDTAAVETDSGVEPELILELDQEPGAEPVPETEAIEEIELNLDAGADASEAAGIDTAAVETAAVETDAAVEPELILELDQELSAEPAPETEAIEEIELNLDAEADAAEAAAAESAGVETDAAVEPEPILELDQELSAEPAPETEAIGEIELNFDAEADAAEAAAAENAAAGGDTAVEPDLILELDQELNAEPVPEAIEEIELNLDVGADASEAAVIDTAAVETDSAVEPELILELDQELNAEPAPEAETIEEIGLNLDAGSDVAEAAAAESAAIEIAAAVEPDLTLEPDQELSAEPASETEAVEEIELNLDVPSDEAGTVAEPLAEAEPAFDLESASVESIQTLEPSLETAADIAEASTAVAEPPPEFAPEIDTVAGPDASDTAPARGASTVGVDMVLPGVPAVPTTVLEHALAVKDDIDEQLLPIFIEEGQELLPEIAANVRAWRESPAAPEPANQLKRLLHTLKGSARMAGAMQLGEATHHIETRLIHGLDSSVPSDVLLEEIENDSDVLQQLFDALVRGEKLSLPAAVAPSVAVAETVAAAAPATTAAPAVPLAPQAAEQDAAKALLRVRSDTVDRLVNDAGEVAIARSRIEAEMLGLKRSLHDLTENVGRLRAQLREIEIQAESQMQSRLSIIQDEADHFDPLEFDRFTRLQELTRFMAESVNDVATIQFNLLNNLGETEAALQQQARMTKELQQELMRIRMVPFSNISERLYRIVRQTAKELGKKVNLEFRGGRVEIDRSVLEKMTSPFEHMLRNSIDHGLETREERIAAGKPEVGEVRIEARQEGNELILTLQDDGKGINLDVVRRKGIESGLIQEGQELSDEQLTQLIFAPGFSTAQSVTQISGRGIGMDVVRNEIGNLGGRIEVRSVHGQGTTFTIHLPLTLAVTHVVLVRVAERLYAIPSIMVEQVQELKLDALGQLYEKQMLEWMGNLYPFTYMARLMGDNSSTPETKRYNTVLLVKSGTQRLALHVDELVKNLEVVVKNIGPQLARVPGVTGATVLGNGDIVMILNPLQLVPVVEQLNRQRRLTQPAAEAGVVPVAAVESALTTAPVIMVVDDSLTVRKITGRLLAREGYQVMTAKDGVDALQQLQEIKPDVMLLDIEMPRMDGFELTRNIRGDESMKHIPIIMISSRTADKHKNYAYDLGVNVFLGKPYQEDELLGHIVEFSAQRRKH